MTGEGKQRDSIICEACGTSVPSYDVVSYGSIELGYRELCTCCFNTEVASALGLERFEHVRLHPVVMTDCAGDLLTHRDLRRVPRISAFFDFCSSRLRPVLTGPLAGSDRTARRAPASPSCTVSRR
jgi:hypothetical protein